LLKGVVAVSQDESCVIELPNLQTIYFCSVRLLPEFGNGLRESYKLLLTGSQFIVPMVLNCGCNCGCSESENLYIAEKCDHRYCCGESKYLDVVGAIAVADRYLKS